MAVRMHDDLDDVSLRSDLARGGGNRGGPQVIGVLEELEYDPDTRQISRRGLRTACVRREWLLSDLCRVAQVSRQTADKWDLGPDGRKPSDQVLIRVVRALSERRRID